MHREFINLVNETVNEAYSNGVELFYESLENSIRKDSFIGENTLEGTLTMLFNESVIQSDEVQDIE